MKNFLSVLLGSILVIIAISAYQFKRISDKPTLIENILKEESLPSDSYLISKYSKEEIDSLLKNAKEDIEIKRIEEMKEEKVKMIFFFMEKNSIKYYISTEALFNPDKQNCRLLAQSTFPAIKLFNHLNALVKQNHKEHDIDKKICNALYGYGKTKI